MKKIIFLFFALPFIVMILNGCGNSNFTEGKITLALSLPPGNPQAAQIQSQLPALVMYVKNGSTRTEVKRPTGGGGSIMINNKQKGEAYSLMNMMGMKYAMKFTQQQMEDRKKQEESHKPKIEVTNETKDILGYHCKKANVTFKDDSTRHPYECWYTNEIKIDNSLSGMGSIPGIDGFPMQMTLLERGMPITVTVKTIEKASEADSLFVLPADYPVKTMQELMQEMQMRRGMQQQPNGTAHDTAAPIKAH